MSEQDSKQPTVKQGAVTPRTLRIEGFRGVFRDATFDDECVSVEPVSPETEAAIKKQFPKAKISVVRDEAAEGNETKK